MVTIYPVPLSWHASKLKTLLKSINRFRKTMESSLKVILINIKIEIEIAVKSREIAQHSYPLVNYYRACMYNIKM